MWYKIVPCFFWSWMYSHFTFSRCSKPWYRQKQELRADLQVDGGEAVLHANATPICTPGICLSATKAEARRIAVRVSLQPWHRSIKCKIAKSRALFPRRQNKVLSAAKEVSLPELLLPLSATQDADKDTSEVITGALMLHGNITHSEMLAKATTLHVRLCSTADSTKAFTTSRTRSEINLQL
jgi:hypothetical protein